MALKIQERQLEEIKRHAQLSYPLECCGALLGVVDGKGMKVIQSILPLENRREGQDARNRFLVTAPDYWQAEESARKQGFEIAGFYHSHPDHAARPSKFDCEHALPWYSYIIIQVDQAIPRKVASWVLAEDRSKFLPEFINMTNTSSVANEAS